MSELIGLVGVCLLILAALSAGVLFIRAASDSLKETPAGNLWGLFIFGLFMGLILIYNARGCHQ
jgi:hypothetical protein